MTKRDELERTVSEKFFDDLVHERRLAGREKYGGGLEHTDPRYDWNRMALEEALDLGQYLAARNRQLMDSLMAALHQRDAALDEVRALQVEVERLRGIVEVNDQRLAAVWDEARAEVERLKEHLRHIAYEHCDSPVHYAMNQLED